MISSEISIALYLHVIPFVSPLHELDRRHRLRRRSHPQGMRRLLSLRRRVRDPGMISALQNAGGGTGYGDRQRRRHAGRSRADGFVRAKARMSCSSAKFARAPGREHLRHERGYAHVAAYHRVQSADGDRSAGMLWPRASGRALEEIGY